MKKELKDFIHLYLGCQMQLPISENPELNGVIQLTPSVLNNLEEFNEWERCKLILRKLSDMTDEELKSLRSERGHLKGVERADMNYIIRLNTWSPEDVHYLLSLHFDIFDLIPSGLAIDSKTLKEKI